MSQYFDNDPTIASQPKPIVFTVAGRTFSLMTDAGVFSKNKLDEGTFILLKSLLASDISGRILDVGCGYGALGLPLAATHPESQLVLIDVNARAVALCEENRRTLGLDNAVVLTSDLYQNVEGPFDFIVTNPPIRAGKKVIYAMFSGAHERLKDGGSLFIVIRKSHGAESASAFIASVFGNCTRIDREKGYHVYRAVKK